MGAELGIDLGKGLEPPELAILRHDPTLAPPRRSGMRTVGRELTELEWENYYGAEPRVATCAETLP